MLDITRPSFLLLIIVITGLAFSSQAQEAVTKSQTYVTEANIPYRTGEGLTEYMNERCKLDVYYPADMKEFATVVWFHGGGLSNGNKKVPLGLQEQGIAVVAVNYRLSPEVKSPVYVEDAAAPVAWTFRNIEKYGGSRERIFVSGHSAGGYLTSMIGLDKRWLAAHEIE